MNQFPIHAIQKLTFSCKFQGNSWVFCDSWTIASRPIWAFHAASLGPFKSRMNVAFGGGLQRWSCCIALMTDDIIKSWILLSESGISQQFFLSEPNFQVIHNVKWSKVKEVFLRRYQTCPKVRVIQFPKNPTYFLFRRVCQTPSTV